jgi:hypothetical protein
MCLPSEDLTCVCGTRFVECASLVLRLVPHYEKRKDQCYVCGNVTQLQLVKYQKRDWIGLSIDMSVGQVKEMLRSYGCLSLTSRPTRYSHYQYALEHKLVKELHVLVCIGAMGFAHCSWKDFVTILYVIFPLYPRDMLADQANNRGSYLRKRGYDQVPAPVRQVGT